MNNIDKIVEEFIKKWNTPENENGFMREDRTGIHLYPAVDWLRQVFTQLQEDTMEEIIKEVCVMKEPLPSANDHNEYNRGMYVGATYMRNRVIEALNQKYL